MPKAANTRKLNSMRHSCAHVMAAVVCKLYPATKLAIGPVIEDGFYYDFELPKTVSENDLPKIEKEMKKIIERNFSFEKFEIPIDEAIDREKKSSQDYKVEILADLKKQNLKKVSYYKTGDFVDLCEGPHVKNTSEIGPFKLLSVAGAYWRGSEKNPMLTRIYGTAFATQQELGKYLKLQEEAKKKDHRLLGQQLELFIISEEIGQGLILWLPKGTIVKEELEKFTKETEEKEGYQRISTPHIARESLYRLSGHLPYFAEYMYPPMQGEEGAYYLKPMNCPHTHMIYKSKKHSYRELPIRYAEFGTVYRHEKSGELFGLLRARGMTQNDAHIYCREDQVLEELVKIMQLHVYYYKVFGIKDYYVELALPDSFDKKEKYFDDAAAWKQSIGLLKEAAKKSKVKFIETEGRAAFYGPKFDFNIKSATGREFGLSTNQLDFGSGKRFKLTYTDKDGGEKIIPYIVHRAPLGSDERFIGFLIEHYKGAFPLWLSPIQVIVIPISIRNGSYAQKVAQSLKGANIRAQIDERAETMQAKIRHATLQKVPYMVIVGDREEKEEKITVRGRKGQDLGQKTLKDFATYLRKEVNGKRRNKDQ